MALGNKNASFIQWFIGVGDMVVINLLFFIVCHVLGENTRALYCTIHVKSCCY